MASIIDRGVVGLGGGEYTGDGIHRVKHVGHDGGRGANDEFNRQFDKKKKKPGEDGVSENIDERKAEFAEIDMAVADVHDRVLLTESLLPVIEKKPASDTAKENDELREDGRVDIVA